LAALALVACGDDGHHLGTHQDAVDDGNAGGNGDAGDAHVVRDIIYMDAPAGSGTGDDPQTGSGSGSGCTAADIIAQCPASYAVTTTGLQENNITVTRGSDGNYTYDINDNGAMYTFDRHINVTCSTGSDGTRMWAAAFSDSCYSTNDIGNFTVDHTGAQYDAKPSKCPFGTYAEGSNYDGDPYGGSTTCEQPPAPPNSSVTVVVPQ
jgi:hypothetical protein